MMMMMNPKIRIKKKGKKFWLIVNIVDIYDFIITWFNILQSGLCFIMELCLTVHPN